LADKIKTLYHEKEMQFIYNFGHVCELPVTCWQNKWFTICHEEHSYWNLCQL